MTQPELSLSAALEALLFVAESPLSRELLLEALRDARDLPLSDGQFDEALAAVEARHNHPESGIRLVAIAGGWEFRTVSEASPFVNQLYRQPPSRLSRAALEVLAIIAYRQPCTRASIDDVRGVDSSRTLRMLLERGLIRILGKADDLGRPLLYGTSDEFLSFFGLHSLSDLPTLREYTELTEEHVIRLQELDETLLAAAGANLAGPHPTNADDSSMGTSSSPPSTSGDGE